MFLNLSYMQRYEYDSYVACFIHAGIQQVVNQLVNMYIQDRFESKEVNFICDVCRVYDTHDRCIKYFKFPFTDITA